MKKGFTLLELIAALGMSSIIVTILISMILKYNMNFKNETVEFKNYFYVSEAYLFIEHEFDMSKDAKVYENKIELIYKDEITKKIIELNEKGNIVIIDMDKNNKRSVNNILTNIKEFSVVQNKNTIYMSIMGNDGEKYEKCFTVIN